MSCKSPPMKCTCIETVSNGIDLFMICHYPCTMVVCNLLVCFKLKVKKCTVLIQWKLCHPFCSEATMQGRFGGPFHGTLAWLKAIPALKKLRLPVCLSLHQSNREKSPKSPWMCLCSHQNGGSQKTGGILVTSIKVRSPLHLLVVQLPQTFQTSFKVRRSQKF